MFILKRSLAQLATAALAVLFLGAPARAFAAHLWLPRQVRQKVLVTVADRYGFDMGIASEHTTEHLNRTLNPANPLPREAIRITDYATWQRAAQELGPRVIGGAVTPHKGGPHLYLVAGGKLADFIDRESPDVFFDTKTKTREQDFSAAYHYPRIFLLWRAPKGALALVGRESSRIVKERGCDGYNCGILMAKTLGKEGETALTSPFHGKMEQLSNLGVPRAEAALKAVGAIGPDLVVQVVQTPDFRNIQENWAHHEIGFQY